MTKMYHMRSTIALYEDADATFAPQSRSDVIFTQEQLSHDVPLRPIAIRHDLNTECRLSSNAPLYSPPVFHSTSTTGRRSAFLQKRPSHEETSPEYYLPMKRSNIDVKVAVMQRQQAQFHPSTPDTMMSSLESIHSTPRSCNSHNFDFSPPNLNYQSPEFLIEHEKVVPANILLPSL